MSSTFTPEDLKTLEETQRMRERLAGVIMGKPDNELPRKPAELMAVTNLLESIDRSVLGRTKLRIDDDSVKNGEANKELLRELMIQMHTKQIPATPALTSTEPVSVPAYTPSGSTVQPGELILKNDVYELPQEYQ